MSGRRAAAVSVIVLCGLTLAAPAGMAQAAGGPRPAPSIPSVGPATSPSGSTNPYAPSYQHPYRHGAVPTRDALVRMNAYAALHPELIPTGETLTYRGGLHSFGVITERPRVYLVFWGRTWGTASVDDRGDLRFSGDPYSAAQQLQEMYRGLGTGGEQWSATMTQYCEAVPVGSTDCPPNAPRVGYPTGGALAGVVYDSQTDPVDAPDHQIAFEAMRAAVWFGNTDWESNHDAQYVIASPPGYHPDGFGTDGYCAWHSGTDSPSGPLVYVNLPYVMDNPGCGANTVNSGPLGMLDGYTIVAGSEYAEAMTDPSGGGWLSQLYRENAEMCEGLGLDANVSTARGAFAMRPTWSDDGPAPGGDCEIAHPVETATP